MTAASDERHPGRASTAWTVFCLLGIAAWIGVTVAVTAQNPDDGKAVTRAFALAGGAFFAVVYAVAAVQMRRSQRQVRAELYHRLALTPVDEAIIRRSARGTSTVGYVYLGFAALVTVLGLVAIGVADDTWTPRLLVATVALVVVWAIYGVWAIGRAWSGADELMRPLGLQLTGVPSLAAGVAGGGPDLHGATTWSGDRHGHRVTILQFPMEAITTVQGGEPRRKAPSTPIQMATLTGEPVRRWREVTVAVEADGAVVVTRQGNGAGRWFLHDLLLAESITRPG